MQPAVVNGVVYVGGNYTGGGNMYALNASNGCPLWKYTNGYSFNTVPAVVNGAVYVASVENSTLYALNASTGAVLWEFGAGPYGLESSPTVVDGVVYFGSDNYNVYGLNASTGALLWYYSTDWPVATSPAVANGVVYVASNKGTAYALNASTGAFLWAYGTGSPSFPLHRWLPTALSTSEAMAYYPLLVRFGRWHRSANLGITTPGPVWARPRLPTACYTFRAGTLGVSALDANSGTLIWNAGIDGSSPAVANGVVYSGGGDPYLYALDAETGAVLWRGQTMGQPVAGSPVVADGVVYIESNDGHLYVFSLPNQ